MTTPIGISASEQGVLRIFAVDLPPEEARRFNRRNGSWPLKAALGAEPLDAEQIAYFDMADLGEMAFSTYLAEGQGVAEKLLAPLRARLDGLTGHVLVVPSRAFAGAAQTITPRAPLRLVATLEEDRPPAIFERLPSEAARGRISGGGAPSPAPARRGWIGPLAVLAGLGLAGLVLLMVLT